VLEALDRAQRQLSEFPHSGAPGDLPGVRRLLIGVPGVRLTVRYTERADAGPPTECPVCRSPLRPIRNQTLTGERIVLGQRCTRCDYWTHGHRRTPVRYVFSAAGIDGRSLKGRA
jgi:hypothetical protein